MDITYLNIISFVIITICYYLVLKTPLTVAILENQEAYAGYKKQNFIRLIAYFIFVVLFQFGINTSSLATRCGGSLNKTIGTAAFWTFIPWLLIFGVVIIILTVFPGFKAAFSNIVGYYYISGRANEILSEILVDAKTENAIDNSFGDNFSTEINGATKGQHQEIQEVLLSLAGNMSILINKIVPSNFIQFWHLLTPLMREQYRNPLNSVSMNDKQDELLKLVVSKDDIGEGFWFGYTAIVLITMVQYYLTTVDCNKSVDIMQQEYQKFLDDEKTKLEKKQKQVPINYTASQ